MLEKFEKYEIENQQIIYGGMDSDGIPPDDQFRD